MFYNIDICLLLTRIVLNTNTSIMEYTWCVIVFSHKIEVHSTVFLLIEFMHLLHAINRVKY